MNSKSQERRRAKRISKNVPIKIKEAAFDSVSETQNLSSSGLYCRLEQYIPPMSKVNMILLVPGNSNGKDTCKKVDCQGTVVRTELVTDPADGDYYNVAIFFSEIKKSDKTIIDKYVKKYLIES